MELILIGDGGHCVSCLDVIKEEGLWYKTIAIKDDSEAENYLGEGKSFLVAFGSIKNPQKRQDVFDRLKSKGATFAIIISPRAYVSDKSEIGEGSIVMHNCLVNSGASIGQNCIINTAAIIEHECTIGDHTHISVNAIVGGGCEIGKRCFIGSGAIIGNNVKIPDDTSIGAGTVIIKSLEKSGIYVRAVPLVNIRPEPQIATL